MMIVAFASGCCIIMAVIVGVIAGRREHLGSLVFLFSGIFAITTFVIVGAFVLQERIDWKKQDDQQVASISSGTIIDLTKDGISETYEVDFGGGRTGRYVRYPFEVPWLAALAVGVVAGVGAGLTTRATAPLIAKLRRSMATPSECFSCGYNLTGNVSGICPECGKPVQSPPS